jgi:hypothetical protein
MLLDFLTERTERAGCHRDGPIGQVAGATIGHDRQQIPQPVGGPPVPALPGDLGQCIGDGGQPERARAALPRALPGQVAQDPAGPIPAPGSVSPAP